MQLYVRTRLPASASFFVYRTVLDDAPDPTQSRACYRYCVILGIAPVVEVAATGCYCAGVNDFQAPAMMSADNLMPKTRGFFSRAGFTLALCLAPAAVGHASSLSAQLAELGHVNTRMCVIPNSQKGLGKLLVLQFEKKATREADKNESLAILKLIVDALENANQWYFGFSPVKRWDTCREREPDYVYWRDYDADWRFMSSDPLKYFAKLAEDLDPALRETPAHAYVLFSLGLVEQRLGRSSVSVNHFETSYHILDKTEDPHGIMPFVLLPLIHHHFGKEGNEELGQIYLNTFAHVVDVVPDEPVEYLPLFKVAPTYPAGALRRGVEGYVVLEFTVDKDGKVKQPVVIEESPAGIFGDAAIEAAESFRYIPTVVNGQRIATEGVRNRITFSIQ
ncbi:MAG: energy transducer TonB [bacterium]